jgi:hypothetical protein
LKEGLDRFAEEHLSSPTMMMMNIVPVDVRAVGQGQVLAGRLAGEAARSFFEMEVGGATRDAIVVLDFRGVRLTTSSYFLGAFEWLWTSRAARENDIFPVLANVNQETRDEIELALNARGFKALFARFDAGGLSEVTPFNLDREAAETYERVASLGEATATDIFRIDPKIQPTGWSNRLALLYEQRLLRRRKNGRQLIYALSWR